MEDKMKFIKRIKQTIVSLWGLSQMVVHGAGYTAFPFSSFHYDFELDKSIYITRLMIPNNWSNDKLNAKQPYYAVLTPEGKNVKDSEVVLSIRMQFCPNALSVSDHKAKLKESYAQGGWQIDESHSKLKTYDDRAVSTFIGLDSEAEYIRYDVLMVLKENPQIIIAFEFQINSLNPEIINTYLPLLDGLIQSIKVSKAEEDTKKKQEYMLTMINKLGVLKN